MSEQAARAPWWIAATFLIYTILWDCGIIGFGFWWVYRGHSGWWLLGCVMIASMSYKPHHWRRLWTRDPSEDKKENSDETA